MRRLRPHLTYANVMVTLLAIGALTGGVAYAANTVFSADIVNDEVYSADVRDDTLAGGGLTAADLRTGSVGTTEILNGGVGSPDVPNEALTGADIADQSGVDNCTHSAQRIGELCVLGSDHVRRDWVGALDQCASYGLRLPTLGEAVLLATNYDIPGVSQDVQFWTDESLNDPGDGQFLAYVANDLALYVPIRAFKTARTLCVTTPTN